MLARPETKQNCGEDAALRPCCGVVLLPATGLFYDRRALTPSATFFHGRMMCCMDAHGGRSSFASCVTSRHSRARARASAGDHAFRTLAGAPAVCAGGGEFLQRKTGAIERCVDELNERSPFQWE